jgi:pimeloyl-ACP methyl ester carboxylesterase
MAEERTLVVWVPGLRLGIKSGDPLLKKLLDEPELKNAEVFAWNHQVGYLSTKYPENLGSGLAAAIEGKWEDAKLHERPFNKIILIGHSFGAVLVRYAYLVGTGSFIKGLPAKEWAAAVSRIVLFAGINRGLFAPEPPGTKKAPYLVPRWFGRQLIELVSQIPLLHFSAEDLLAGSDFITNLRLWWIRKFDAMGDDRPVVVQLIGTDDGIVRQADSLDIEQDRSGNQLLIEGADHASIIRITDKQGKLLEGRYALIRKAVLDNFPEAPSPIPEDEQKRPVVFVVHGIRASNGGWVGQAADQIRVRLNNAVVVKPTYWYFSALDFLVPILRKRKIRWFKDTYSYYLARSPRAEFHFLGHSNGTYLLGQSLLRLTGVQFNRVVLAGSVLPKDFKWELVVQRRQVEKIWNHRASKDIPVAILCNAMRGLGMKDVGTGGFDGFADIPQITDCHFHSGGHSAALEKVPLVNLAFQVAGQSPALACKSLAEAPSRAFRTASGIAVLFPVLLTTIILSVAWFGGAPLQHLIKPHINMTLIHARIVAGLACLAILSFVLKFV